MCIYTDKKLNCVSNCVARVVAIARYYILGISKYSGSVNPVYPKYGVVQVGPHISNQPPRHNYLIPWGLHNLIAICHDHQSGSSQDYDKMC